MNLLLALCLFICTAREAQPVAYHQDDVFLGIEGGFGLALTDGTILHLSRSGTLLHTLILPVGTYDPIFVGGAIVGQDGNLYVCYVGAGGGFPFYDQWIDRFLPDGSYDGHVVQISPGEQFSVSGGLLLLPNGDLLLHLQFDDTYDLYQITTSGTIVTQWMTPAFGMSFTQPQIQLVPGIDDHIYIQWFDSGTTEFKLTEYDLTGSATVTDNVMPVPANDEFTMLTDVVPAQRVVVTRLGEPTDASGPVDVRLLAEDFSVVTTYSFLSLPYAESKDLGWIGLNSCGTQLWLLVYSTTGDPADAETLLYRMDLMDGSYTLIQTFTGFADGLTVNRGVCGAGVRKRSQVMYIK